MRGLHPPRVPHSTMTMRLHSTLAFLLPTALVAQDPGMGETPVSEPTTMPPSYQAPSQSGQAAPTAPSTLRGRLGLDFTNGYYFRGILQENQGLIAQPWIEFGYDLVDPSEDLRKLELRFGSFNTLENNKRFGNGEIWYESDFYIDLTAGLGERLTLGARYTAYTSPNSTFNAARRFGLQKTVQELAFTFGYDDRNLLLNSIDSGIQPYAKVAFELDGQRDNGVVGNEGIYAEFGLRPSFRLVEDDPYLRLSIPVTLGFSLGNYYESIGGRNDDAFGYFDIGAEVSTALNFLPQRMGPWQVHGGLHWLLLGDNLEARNGGDTSELILSVGMSTSW